MRLLLHAQDPGAIYRVPNHDLLQKAGMEVIKLDLQELTCEHDSNLSAAQPAESSVQIEAAEPHFFDAMTLEGVGKFAE